MGQTKEYPQQRQQNHIQPGRGSRQANSTKAYNQGGCEAAKRGQDCANKTCLEKLIA
tara:strand:- start:1483 stop:1653 length:171 start_codon:yes stop_codon:yes gene_type:complete